MPGESGSVPGESGGGTSPSSFGKRVSSSSSMIVYGNELFKVLYLRETIS